MKHIITQTGKLYEDDLPLEYIAKLLRISTTELKRIVGDDFTIKRRYHMGRQLYCFVKENFTED